MGKPAARLKDKHVCPIHGGGPILSPGFPTVRIGGQPAARAGDLATCVGGPPDMILAGSATVFIGGLPAARMGVLPCSATGERWRRKLNANSRRGGPLKDSVDGTAWTAGRVWRPQ